MGGFELMWRHAFDYMIYKTNKAANYSPVTKIIFISTVLMKVLSEAASPNVQNFRHGVSTAVKCKDLARTGGWRVVSARTKNILWLTSTRNVYACYYAICDRWNPCNHAPLAY